MIQRSQSRSSIGADAPEAFEVLHRHACGIDIGSASHWVSVPPERDSQAVREFGCYTPDLVAMAAWLKQCQIETVAMESTGVYWIPVFQMLEAHGFEVILVNAHQVKSVPGRKSDVLDCQWLRQLHSYGLLSGSFRPDASICVLRSYIRQRDTLIADAARHVQRMQKALTQMNIQLHQVLSDLTGLSGLRILKAIVAGEHDPHKLAALKHERVRKSEAEIAAALSGDYRPEHLFVLAQELALYESYQQQIVACDVQIEDYLNQLPTQVAEAALAPPTCTRKRRQNQPSFDLKHHLHRISGVDFTEIDGMGVLTVQTILSEVGLNARRFASAKQFASWLGLSPGTNISGGKRKSAKTRPGSSRAANAFRLAAMAAGKSDSALGAFFRRLKTRLGAPKAITATAHKLARVFYKMWVTHQSYQDVGAGQYEQQFQQRKLKYLRKQAAALGFDLTERFPVNALGDTVS
ncbi:IS110 family transposase [Cyanobacteria bacterium FACHB-63]|nr:IS110 family transposase [Cyanobacteria bacterium FACHB-63]